MLVSTKKKKDMKNVGRCSCFDKLLAQLQLVTHKPIWQCQKDAYQKQNTQGYPSKQFQKLLIITNNMTSKVLWMSLWKISDYCTRNNLFQTYTWWKISPLSYGEERKLYWNVYWITSTFRMVFVMNLLAAQSSPLRN